MLSQWKPWAGFKTTGLAGQHNGWWWPGNLGTQEDNCFQCILAKVERKGSSRRGKNPQDKQW